MERVRQFYQLLEARAWDDLAPLLAETVVYELPQTRERITGRDEYLAFNANYPGDWHLSVRRVVDGGDRETAVWISAIADGQDVDNLAFITFDDQGLISAIVDFWPEAYEPPPGRPPSTTRY
jgi:ketosteroid isomerase-like protein